MSPRSPRLLVSSLSFLLLAATGAAQAQNNPNLCPPPSCGTQCSNVPYVFNNCWTTPYGPAAADVVQVCGNNAPTTSTNMLKCSSGPYALCFYSGPPEKTGTNPYNNALPCVVDPSGKTANCTCQYYSNGVNYVDINSILNLNAYYQAVAECGASGAGCANIANSDFCSAYPQADTCKEATVCQYVRNQNAKNPSVSLVPNADTISDFGFKMASDYNMKGVSPCSNGRYAGCMTAACTFPNGTAPNDGGLVQCSCPIVQGPFQIGQIRPDGIPYACDLGPTHVWSASYTVAAGSAGSK